MWGRGEGLHPTHRIVRDGWGTRTFVDGSGEQQRHARWGVGCLGEFLKGYMRKKLGRDECGAGYSQGGDSRGLAQACDKAKCFRSADQRC
jgi:hypothetical protein